PSSASTRPAASASMTFSSPSGASSASTRSCACSTRSTIRKFNHREHTEHRELKRFPREPRCSPCSLWFLLPVLYDPLARGGELGCHTGGLAQAALRFLLGLLRDRHVHDQLLARLELGVEAALIDAREIARRQAEAAANLRHRCAG